jgi:hypothetical protein
VLRPHVLTLSLLAVLPTPRARAVPLIPLPFVVRANAHGGVVLGGPRPGRGLAAARCAGARARAGRSRARTLIIDGAGGTGARRRAARFGIYTSSSNRPPVRFR